jgi:hypothetical protein
VHILIIENVMVVGVVMSGEMLRVIAWNILIMMVTHLMIK